MIAFDLDGVIFSDVDYELFEEPNYEIRNNLLPNFVPYGDYYIITGRPESDKERTHKRINTTFNNLPKRIFMRPSLEVGVSVFKANIINSHPEITIFIESNSNQVKKIKKLIRPQVKVLHFSNFVEELFLQMNRTY